MTPWFDHQTSGMIGGLLGSLLGIGIGGGMGGLTWFYVKKGWKKFTYCLYGFTILAGLILLGIGLTALLTEQPYHVWYPFLLCGGFTTLLVGILFVVVIRLFKDRERQIMEAQDL